MYVQPNYYPNQAYIPNNNDYNMSYEGYNYPKSGMNQLGMYELSNNMQKKKSIKKYSV